MRFSLLLLLTLPFLAISQNKVPFDKELNENWVFKSKNEAFTGKATVPGNIHTDLKKNDLISEPYSEMNEMDLQWIQDSTWIYETKFMVTSEELSYAYVFLEFEGLDTYAKIFLNNQEIGASENMFVAWKDEVKGNLINGENSLRIIFTSPYEVQKNTAKTIGYQLPASNDAGESKISPWVRKAPYHFGWDWAPKFTTCGIYMPVKLQFKNEIYIENILVYTSQLSDEKATINYEIQLNNFPTKSLLELELSNNENVRFSGSFSTDFKTIKGEFQLENPEIWWPNGWGEQPLLDFKCTLGNYDSRELKIGIRQVKTHLEKDTTGEAFYFTVNGHRLFAKGANYIPQDVFINQKSDDEYEKLILQAKAANFNMLRVWGGGVYEREVFYDLCDQHGILVWQDFMFACSMYPSDDQFLNNVQEEVTYQVKRLRNHASIVHWNGNNEVNVAWGNWGWQTEYDLDEHTQRKLKEGYRILFEKEIPQTLAQLDNRSYTHTSPLSNWGPKGNFDSGSMHYWGVWHNREPFENYQKNVGRFMSEYGFQSFPSIELLKNYVHPDSLFLESKSMQHRQKSYIGNGLILQHVNQYFPSPDSFSEFIELSQLTQAIAYEQAIDAHRLDRPHCMGTLYWQLNDCWPGPSWSTIDYVGNLKTAHYKVSEMYQTLLPIIKTEERNLSLFISNDGNTLVKGQLKVSLVKVKSGKFKKSRMFDFQINRTQSIAVSTIKNYLKKKQEKYYVNVQVIENNQVVSSRNFIPNFKVFSGLHSLQTITGIYINSKENE